MCVDCVHTLIYTTYRSLWLFPSLFQIFLLLFVHHFRLAQRPPGPGVVAVALPRLQHAALQLERHPWLVIIIKHQNAHTAFNFKSRLLLFFFCIMPVYKFAQAKLWPGM